MHNCQPLHRLFQRTSFLNSVIFTLLATIHYFAKYPHLDKNSRLCRNFLYLYNSQPLHHLLQRTSFLNSVISTLLASTHYFTKYHHFDKNSRLYRNFLYLYYCQPLHHLLQHNSFRNSVIFTLLAITHYFAKYHHLDKIVVFTSISCTCIPANLSITSFNSPVSATFPSLPPSLPSLPLRNHHRILKFYKLTNH